MNHRHFVSYSESFAAAVTCAAVAAADYNQQIRKKKDEQK